MRTLADDLLGDASGVSISYPDLVRELVPGNPVLIDDGSIELVVESASASALECRVVRGGSYAGPTNEQRAAQRNGSAQRQAYVNQGFRMVRTLYYRAP